MKFGKEIQRQQIPGWSPYYLDYKALKKIIAAANKSLAESNSLLIEVLRPLDVLSSPSPATKKDTSIASPPEITFAGSVSSGDANVAPVSVPTVGRDEERGPEFQRSKAMFFFKLERELEKINTFYLQKEAELKLRLGNLLSKRRLALQLMSSDEEGATGNEGGMQSSEWRAVQEGFRLLEKDLGKLQKFIDVNATGFRKILKKWDKRSKSKTKELYLARQVEVQPCFNRQLLVQLSDAVAACLIDPVNAEVDPSLEDATLTPSLPSDAILSQQLTVESGAPSMRVFRDFEANLSKAVQWHDNEAVKEQLALAESSLPSQAQNGRTHVMRILWRAAMLARPDIADAIINSVPFDLSFVDDINGRTCLHEASISGKLRLADICLRHGTHVDSADAYGRTALHYACLEGHSSVAEKLLVAGATPNVLDMDNYSPLIYAVVNGWLDCIRVLVSQPGVTVGPTSLKSPSDLIPLSLAAQYGHADISNFLIRQGAQSIANTNGEYPIHLAAREGHVDVCRLLVRHPDPSSKGRVPSPNPTYVDTPDKYNEWTPLLHAARNGHVKCVQILLDAGANPLAMDENSRTALYHAAWFGHIECVNKLINAVTLYNVNYGGNAAKIPIPKSAPGTSSTAFTISSGFVPSPFDPSSVPGSIGPESKLDSDTDPDVDMIPSLLLPPPIMPFRIYGHNYLDNSYLVQVVLGHPFSSPTDPVLPVKLVPDVARQTDVGLRNSAARAKATPSLKVVMTSRPSESGGLAASHSIVLPLADESEAFSFQLRHLDDLTLEFSFYPAFGSKIIGRAVASPRGLCDLQRGNAKSIPILDHRLNVIGELLFDIYIVTPFKEVALEVGGTVETYWKSTSGPSADMPIASLSSIGLSSSVHQGPSPSSPSIRSPAVTATAGNKIALSSLSGEFVHLVIQVTRDFIPVVCAEWNVPFVMNDQKEPLVDVGVADLSADQFQRLVVVAGRTSDAKLPLAQLSSASEWQRYLSGSFCTLTEVLKALPLKYGVSLELRYPNPVIRQRYSLGRNHEPNEFVDSVLRTVYSALATHSGASPRRKIVFSSFVPTICTAINWKQPNYAVFFASKGGVARPAGNDTGVLLADEEEIDTRCRSISAAVNFARNNNLLGLILNESILQQVPSLILGIKEHGVMLAAFGNTNLLPLSSATGTSTKVDAMLTEGVLTFVD